MMIQSNATLRRIAEGVIAAVARAHGLTPEAVINGARTPGTGTARRDVVWLLYYEHEMTDREIEVLMLMERETVMKAIRAVDRAYERGGPARRRLDAIRAEAGRRAAWWRSSKRNA